MATHEIELILGLLVAVVALVALSHRVGIAYPIFLVIGGLVLGIVPGLPHVDLAPDLVFLLFLPPLLYAAAWSTSARDLRANARPIGQLAVGLVLFGAVIVAAISKTLIPDLTWAAAFAFGAIVSPPDAVAATTIARRLGVPHRLVTILEGESLINDATALVCYSAAVTAALTGAFSLGGAALQFVVVAVGGVAIGLAAGWAAAVVYGLLDAPPIANVFSFLVPYMAYLPAEQLGVSGVIAAVTAGLYVSRRSVRLLTSEQRISAYATWDSVVFLLNGLVFILIGLQLPGILESLSPQPIGSLIGLGAIISVAVIATRIAWVFPTVYLPRWLSPSLRARDPAPPWQWAAVVSWAGMRGVVSLATALALPLTLANGAPFPMRNLLIFLTFCVILATLVGQGLTLPWLIRVLGVAVDDVAEAEEYRAREAADSAALQRLDALSDEWPAHLELIDQLRARYQHRAHHTVPPTPERNGEADQELLEHTLIRRAVLDAERDAIVDLRDRGEIGDEVLRHLERELDLEEVRMEA